MRDASLPAALLCASLGLALGFGSQRMLVAGLALMALTALTASRLPVPASAQALVFIAAAIATAGTAATVYLPGGRAPALLAILALAVGALAGGLIAVGSGGWGDLARALPAALLAPLAGWFVARGWGIAVKVAASWLVAVAVLAATLPIVPTPGYEADHMQ